MTLFTGRLARDITSCYTGLCAIMSTIKQELAFMVVRKTDIKQHLTIPFTRFHPSLPVFECPLFHPFRMNRECGF